MSNLHPFYHNPNHAIYCQHHLQNHQSSLAPVSYDHCLPMHPVTPPISHYGMPPTPPHTARYGGGGNGHESRYSMVSGASGCYDQSQSQSQSHSHSQQTNQYQQHQTMSQRSMSHFGSDNLSQLNYSRSHHNNNNNNNNTNNSTTTSRIIQTTSYPQPQQQQQHNISYDNVTMNTVGTLTSVSASGSGPSNHQHQQQSGGANYLSDVESAILRSSVPINLSETEEITVNGQRGIWANRSEVVNWRGVLPINEYAINEDSSPEIITKRAEHTLTYIQELAVRYLRPPTPPTPGEILITQEVSSLTPPAPPLIIRQQPPRPSTPEPMVVREAPPPPPSQVGRKIITISGKRLPPPPRKVIIERLAPLPSKPQAVLIERWLPYSQAKRRVIFQRSNERDPVIVKPRNVIIQWEAPQVVIKKDFKYLGIIRANPVEYVQRYGSTLKTSRELPDFVLDIKPPAGVVLAADYQYNQVHELEGDLHAMRLVDLEREGLSEYRTQLQRLGINYVGAGGVAAEMSTLASQSNLHLHSTQPSLLGSRSNVTSSIGMSNQVPTGYAHQYAQQLNQQQHQYPPASPSIVASSQHYSHNYGSGVGQPPVTTYNSNPCPRLHHNSSIVAELFSQIDRDLNGRIAVDEAEKLLLKLNSRLGRRYSDDDIRRFFLTFETNRDGTIELQEFRTAFERVL